MSGRNKRNKEIFNKIFRKLCKQVKPEQLTASRRRWEDRHVGPRLNQPMTVSKFKLLSKETRKWYLKEPRKFEAWAQNWDSTTRRIHELDRPPYKNKNVIDRNKLEKSREGLITEYFESLSRFVSGHEGVDPLLREVTPEARVEAVLERRRAKVTNKMARGVLWSPGTLLEVKDFHKHTHYGWAPTIEWAGWFFPTTDVNWKAMVEAFSAGQSLLCIFHYTFI